MGEEFRDLRAGLTVFLELVCRARDGEGLLVGRHPGLPLVGVHEVGELLAEVFLELGLVVEKVLLRRGSTLEEIDHALGLRLWLGGGLCQKGLVQHRGQGGNADTIGGFSEEMAAIEKESGLTDGIGHGGFLASG